MDGFIDYGQALRLSAALSRDAAVRFGRAADVVDSPVFAPVAARRDVLLRMADTAACGAELADLSAQWTETVLAALDALRDGTRRPDAERRLHALERAAQSAKAKYEERIKGMVDPYGGDWRCGLDTAEFILIEVAHMRRTLATGEWDDHPRRPWW